MLSTLKFEIILCGMAQLLRYAAWRYPVFAARLKERNIVAQIKARDEEVGRWFAIRDGKLTSRRGLRAQHAYSAAVCGSAKTVNCLSSTPAPFRRSSGVGQSRITTMV